MKIDYQDFVEKYPRKYKASKFYLEFLKLKNRGLNAKKIKERLKSKVPESTIYFWFTGVKPLTFKEFSKIKAEFNEDSNQLATIVGHVLGDGGITKQKFLRYCNTEEFLINEFRHAMKKIFNVEPSNCYTEASGITRLVYARLYSRALLCLFGEFSIGENTKRITPQIDKMPLRWKIKLISAWYDDDGSVPTTEKYKCIAFKQKDENLISWIQKTLKEADINSKLDKDGNQWHLRILNYLDMVKFKDRIGFSKGYRKQLHLEKLIGEVKFPHWKTKLKILELLKERPRRGRELTDILKIDRTVVWHHLFGGRHKERVNTPGLIDICMVSVKQDGRLNLYYLNMKEYNKFSRTLDKEKMFRQNRP